MSKAYLSVAIDHGTTNSAIAVMGSDGPRPVFPDGNSPIMPSAVYMTKFGRTLVGEPAYQAMSTKPASEGTGYTGYKIRIGQDERYAFDEVKKVMTAPELGGVVIGELLKAAREETGDDIREAVITVPAKFEMSAIEGTREAARLAGLRQFPLLQEPIAAALAYGFSNEEERAQWLVFDLGGGTLDVSLVIVRDGQLAVPEAGHGGDNRLGGRKFDRELMDHVLTELCAQYDLEEFSEKNDRSSWGRLMLAVEQAKIRLSEHAEATVDVTGELCKDRRGRPVKVEVPVTREAFERMIAPDVEKAVYLCQNLLNANRVRAEEVNGLILVGGPTKIPYVQRVLRDRLGIPLYQDIDPMIAVVSGAAVYAATVAIENGDRPPRSVAQGEIDVTVEYERFSKIPRYSLIGTVDSSGPDLGDLSVEVKRTDGGWTSGRLPIDEHGVFEVDLQLIARRKPQLSSFQTSVLGGQGQVLARLDEPEIWYPYPEGKLRLANSLRVALQGNRTHVLIKSGADLPARGQQTFRTTKALRKGSAEDLLKIPIVEAVTHLLGAEDDRADSNVHVGTLEIQGSDKKVTRDLPEGAELDLTIHIDESRELHVVAYVPLLQDEFETKFQAESFGVTADEAEGRFTLERQRLESIRSLQEERPVEVVGEHLAKIDSLGTVPAIEKEMKRARDGEADAAFRAWTRTLELSGALQQIWEEQREVRVAQKLEQVKNGAREAEDHERLEKIGSELASCAANGNGRGGLEEIEGELDEIDTHIRKRPFFQLGLALAALSGLRVSAEQNRAFEAAAEVINELIAKGAPDVLTTADLERVRQAHQRLVEAYPDLDQHIARFLAKLPPGMTAEDAYGSTLKGASD